MLGGVAAGFGDYFDVDPVLVRLGFVLLTFATGIGILFYIICWVNHARRHSIRLWTEISCEKMSEEVKEAAERVASEARGVGEEARVAAERVASEVREVGESGRVHLIGGAILVAFGLMLLADRILLDVRLALLAALRQRVAPDPRGDRRRPRHALP